jgi:hypothetical protein
VTARALVVPSSAPLSSSSSSVHNIYRERILCLMVVGQALGFSLQIDTRATFYAVVAGTGINSLPRRDQTGRAFLLAPVFCPFEFLRSVMQQISL